MEQENTAVEAVQAMPAPEPETFRLVGTPEQVGKMFTALGLAQSRFTELKKTEEVTVYPKVRADGFRPPPYKFKYATLEDIIKATRPALTENGLTITQPPCGGEVVRTMLCHKDGGRMETIMYIPQYRDPKEMGGFITYIRRYSQAAILNVAGDEDADGNGNAVGTDPGPDTAPQKSEPRSEPQRQAQPVQQQRATEQPAQQEGPRLLNQTEKAELTKLIRMIHDIPQSDRDAIEKAVTREVADYITHTNKRPDYVISVNDYKPLHALLSARATKARQDRNAEGPQ